MPVSPRKGGVAFAPVGPRERGVSSVSVITIGERCNLCLSPSEGGVASATVSLNQGSGPSVSVRPSERGVAFDHHPQ